MTAFTTTIAPSHLAEALCEMEVYTKGDEIVMSAAADYILSTLDEKPGYQQREGDLVELKTAVFGSEKWDDGLPIGCFIEMVQTTEQARAGALRRAQSAEEETRVIATDLGLLKDALFGSDNWHGTIVDIEEFLKIILNTDEEIAGFKLLIEGMNGQIANLLTRINSAINLLNAGELEVTFHEIGKALKHLKGEA